MHAIYHLSFNRISLPAFKRAFTSRSFTMSYRNGIIDVSPPVHRGMHELDRAAFRRAIPLLAAKVPAKATGTLRSAKELRRTILDIIRVKPVLPAPENDHRIILLNVTDEAELSEEAREFLKLHSAEFLPHTLELDYDYWTADDILHAIVPEEISDEAPSGFASIGHIAHVNLRDEYLPYKYLIGQVILDKNTSIKTVVNKVNTISNQFRVFQMELLAGEPSYVVEHHESNCRFTFDFTKVYWNSRLHTEHERLVKVFSEEDVVADVFAGVGPFAIPAAKKGCGVYANDLNPESHKFLLQNICDNKVTTLVRPYCLDGREFIRAVFGDALDNGIPPPPPKLSKAQQKEQKRRERSRSPSRRGLDRRPSDSRPRRRRVSHFAMNLPDSAIEFLDAFRGVLSPANVGDRNLNGVYDDAASMPTVHCYCFTREAEPEKAEADIRQRVEERLGHPLTPEVSFHFVRAVAPKKDMWCISFRLPREVAFAG